MPDGKISFALEGSLIDLNSQNIPNYTRPSPVNLEKTFEGSLQLYPVEAFRPAFSTEDGSFVLQPFTVNTVTWNMSLGNPLWQKGSNVTVRPDLAVAPDATMLADRVGWLPKDPTSSPDNQVIRRTIELDAASDYVVSAILRLRGGQFSNQDVIRIVGDGVLSFETINLSALNRKQNRYVLLQGKLKTSGRNPINPNNIHTAADFTVNQVNPTSVIVAMPVPAGTTVALNALAGGQVTFNNLGSSAFDIVGNSALAGGVVTIEFAGSTNLVAAGVTLSSRAVIKDAPPQNVTLEVYVESSASLDWGGIQVEKGKFRTSMIYQEGQIEPRGSDYLLFRESPIRAAKTFGVFLEEPFWRGDGNVFNFGNFRSWFADGYLYVAAGATEARSRMRLAEDKPFTMFVQVAEESASLSLYVNGILEARSGVANFIASPAGNLSLISEGVRSIRRLFTTDSVLSDGQPPVGSAPSGEIKDLFGTAVVIDPVAISSHAPTFLLPPITIPAPDPPIARSRISGYNSTTNVVTVEDGTAFALGQSVTVLRGADNKPVLQWTTITNKSGANLTLSTSSGIVIGDFLIFGNYTEPGQAACRFPFTPVDAQTILVVDPGNRRVQVSSTLGFGLGRAFVQTPLYQDVAEVLIGSTDPVNRWINLDSVTELTVGDVISQPFDELTVEPHNYFSGLLRGIDGVSVAFKYQNGMIIQNSNPFPVLVRPFVRVFV